MPSLDALGPFLKRVEACLAQLSHDELVRRLLSHARGLPARQREPFIELLETRPEPRKQSANLLEQIEAFVEELENGAYFEGWGWDRDYEEERALGDESWAPAMDALFAEASRAFLAEDWDVAASAYGRLLRALDLDEAFSGAESPEVMLDTDLTEARVRYFRAVFESAPPLERATALREAIQELGSEAWATFNLTALGEAAASPLPDLDSFLPSWVAALEALQLEPDYVDRYRARVLAEAAFLSEGVGGLAKLSRAYGDRLSLFYERWLDELIRADRSEEALDAAREGAERALEGIAAAGLADRLAELAWSMGRSDVAELGRRLAWRKQPSAIRFLKLHQSLRSRDPDGHRLSVEEREAASKGEYRLPDHLGCMLKLAADDLEAILAATAKASPLGWTYGSTMGSASVPFLLVGASGAEVLPDGAGLAGLWHDLVSRGLRPDPYSTDWLEEKGDRPLGLTWEPLLRAAITRTVPTPASREKAMNVAREAVVKRIEAIVSGGHRKAYGRAAQLAVSVGEVMSLSGDRTEATSWLVGVRATYPRHSAFKRELESAIRRSRLI